MLTYPQRIVVSLCTVAILFASWRASAGGEVPSAYQNPGSDPSREAVRHSLDEHIDPFNGMLQIHHSDLVLPGNGGFDLALQRSYSSPGPHFGSISDSTSYNRTPNVGVGWNFLIGGRLLGALGSGGACTGGNQMSFETPDGHRQALLRRLDGSFISRARWKAVCVSGGVNVFAPNGTKYEMLQTIVQGIPATIQTAPFLYPTKVEDRNGNFVTFGYTTVGGSILLNAISASDGRTVSFGYTLTGDVRLLTSVATPDGTWTYEYYPTPAITNVTTGNGVAYFLKHVRPPSGGFWTYNYYAPGQVGGFGLAQLLYPEGGQVLYDYGQINFGDGAGNTTVVTEKEIGGAFVLSGTSGTWQYAYTPGSVGVNATTTVTSPVGVSVYEHVGTLTVGAGSRWSVGSLVKLTQKTTSNAVLQTETFTWDKQQISSYPTIYSNGTGDSVTYAPILTSRVVNRDGVNYSTTYSDFNVHGGPQTIVEAGERTRTTTRNYFVDESKWILNIPDDEIISGSGTIARAFDAKGNLLNETKFGVSTSYTYSPSDGSLTSRTDANGKVTYFSDYFRGVARTENRPGSVLITRTVDGAGNVTSQSDGASNIYTYAYDSIRRLIQVVPPTGSATNIVWTGSGLRTSTRGTLVEETSIDGHANPYIIKRNGIPTAQAFDPLRRKVFESLPGKATSNGAGGYDVVGTTFPRDILGRVRWITNPIGYAKSLTYTGSVTTERDERNFSTTYSHWSFGDPEQRFLSHVSRPNGHPVSMARDNLGNITAVTMGAYTRTYGYNGSYFLTSISDPETGVTTFGRDNVGNMTSRTTGGRTTNFTYDGLNRLTGVSYQSGSTVTIGYLGNGRTSSISNGTTVRTFGYDANANLTSETVSVGGESFTIGYTYNGNDALATITYPRTGEVVTYAPDPLGRPTTASPFVSGIVYFDSGNPKEFVFSNGIKTTFEETARQFPQRVRAQRSDTTQPEIVDKLFSYDETGNMSQYLDQVNVGNSMLMSYDSVNQLISTVGPWGNANMAYDAVGNLTQYSVGSTPGTYAYDPVTNRLGSFNGRGFTYDGYGNVTSDGLHAYQFDDASNMTCVDCGTANQITYTYDGNNRRVTRTKGAETTYYVHAASGDLLLEYVMPSRLATMHVYLHGKRVASKRVQL